MFFGQWDKLKGREVKIFAKGHVAINWGNQIFYPGSRTHANDHSNYYQLLSLHLSTAIGL